MSMSNEERSADQSGRAPPPESSHANLYRQQVPWDGSMAAGGHHVQPLVHSLAAQHHQLTLPAEPGMASLPVGHQNSIPVEGNTSSQQANAFVDDTLARAASSGAFFRTELKRPFRCAECDKQYSRQEHLDRHNLSKHRDDRPHVCAICNKGFARRDILKRHEHNHARKAEASGAFEALAAKIDPDDRALLPLQEGTTADLSQFDSRKVKGRRILACDHCSYSKLKCNGEQPCDRCIKPPGHVCTYARPWALHRLTHAQQSQPNTPTAQSVPVESSSAAVAQLDQPIQSRYALNTNIDPVIQALGRSGDAMSAAAPFSIYPFSEAGPNRQATKVGAHWRFLDDLYRQADLQPQPENASVDSNRSSAVEDVATSSVAAGKRRQESDEAPRNVRKRRDTRSASAAEGLLALSAPKEDDNTEMEGDQAIGPWPRQLSLISGAGPITPLPVSRSGAGQANVPAVYHHATQEINSAIDKMHAESAFAHLALAPPVRSQLDAYVDTYFRIFDKFVPFIHVPTFDRQTCQPALLLAVSAVGAYFTPEIAGSREASLTLADLARRTCHYQVEAKNNSNHELWFNQVFLLLLILAPACGDRAAFEMAMCVRGIPHANGRRDGWDRGMDETIGSAHRSVEEQWARWIQEEQRTRMAWAVVMTDVYDSVLWSVEPSVIVTEVIRCPVPNLAVLWEAPTAQAWHALLVSGQEPVRATLEPYLPKMAADPMTPIPELADVLSETCGRMLLISALHLLAWRRRHWIDVERLALGGDASQQPTDALSARLDNAFEYVERHVLPCQDSSHILVDQRASDMGTDMHIALLWNLVCLVNHLPVSTMQQFASGEFDAVRLSIQDWANAKNGQNARLSLYHATQLLTLCHEADESNRKDLLVPFAVLYGTLAVVIYIRYIARYITHSRRAVGRAPAYEVHLTKLNSRLRPNYVDWIEGKAFEGALSVLGFGDISQPTACNDGLEASARILQSLPCGRYGFQFSLMLRELGASFSERV